MKNRIILMVLVFILMSCGASKVTKDIKGMTRLNALVDAKNFEFIAIRANPMATQSMNAIANSGLLPPGSTVGSIEVFGTNNFLKVVGDSVSANLPFFGERRFGGGYGDETGIIFDGVPKTYQLEKQANKIIISFNVAEGSSDNYSIWMTLFTDFTASVSVTSVQRNAINYTGRVKEISSSK